MNLAGCDALHEKHLVADAAARALKSDPRSLLADGRRFVVAAKLAKRQFDDASGGPMYLERVARANRVVLNLHLGDPRLEEIVNHNADMPLHSRSERVLAIRELVCAGATEIKTICKLAMKHRLHFLGKLLH